MPLRHVLLLVPELETVMLPLRNDVWKSASLAGKELSDGLYSSLIINGLAIRGRGGKRDTADDRFDFAGTASTVSLSEVG
jgi:hypothetical protein